MSHEPTDALGRELWAYSVGICYASVCTSLTDEDAERRLNASHPTGVSPWRVAQEAFASGDPNPTPCPDQATHRHVLFSC